MTDGKAKQDSMKYLESVAMILDRAERTFYVEHLSAVKEQIRKLKEQLDAGKGAPDA